MRQGARHPYRDAPPAIPRPRARRSYVRSWMITVVGMPIAMTVAAWVLSVYGTADANAGVLSLVEPPAPLDAPGPCAEFDKPAVTHALARVVYKDCGTGGSGKVKVTFAPSGVVIGSSVTSGEYSAATKSCVAGRFGAVKIPPFCPPDPKTVGWGINL